MIATYIQELLATNNRVIVPNYGAFLVRATSKSKDANTLEEKLKDIYFSPFLKFNDELLEKFIIKKEKITKEQAAEKIKQFIEDIKKELDQEKPYKIEGFGEFVADKQGKVQFLTIAKEDKKPATKTTSTTKKATPIKKEKAKTDEKLTVAEPKKEEIKEEPKKDAKPASPASKLKEFKPEEKEAETKKIETPVSKAKETETEEKPVYSYKKEKKPINKGLVWSIAIGLPVAAIFIWAVLNVNTVKKIFNPDKAKTEKVAKKKTTTTKKPVAKKETTAKTTTKPAAKKETTTKPVAPQKKYYIIAGSFKNEKYAISYLTKLQTEGYNAEKLAKRNGMHAVSYNSFTDKRKAIAEYKFLVQEKQLQAWILYY